MNVTVIISYVIVAKMPWMRMPVDIVVLISIFSMMTGPMRIIAMLVMMIMPVLMPWMRVSCVSVSVYAFEANVILIAVRMKVSSYQSYMMNRVISMAMVRNVTMIMRIIRSVHICIRICM